MTEDGAVRRRYTCGCGNKFSTIETLFEFTYGPKKFWTGAKNQMLRDAYKNLTIPEIAKLLGVTERAVYEQAHRLKIRRKS